MFWLFLAALNFVDFAHGQILMSANRFFPEESPIKRTLWDQGCADWPIEIMPGQIGVRRNPEIKIEKGNGNFRVLSRMIVRPERGESVENVMKTLDRMLSGGKAYEKWVMPGINENPNGGEYFVQVENLTAREIIPLERYVLSGPYNFKVLWFKRDGISSIEFRKDVENLPDCEMFKKTEMRTPATRFVFRMTPREDLLELMMGEVWILKVGNQAELRMRLIARPSKVVYELMPDSVLNNQLHARGRRIFENFLEFRKNERVSLLSSPASDRKAKGVGTRASGR